MWTRQSNRNAAIGGKPVARLSGSVALALAMAAVSLAAAAADDVKVPVQIKAVDDVVLFVDERTRLVELGGVFGNRPTDCVAESSDESVVRVTIVRGSDMLVKPVGVGEATITITASNSAGSASTMVPASILDRAPEAVGELPSRTVTVGKSRSVALADGFSGTNLVYSVASPDEMVATARISDGKVIVVGHRPGDVALTVTAENTAGSAVQPIAVTIKDDPPAAVGALDAVPATVGDRLNVNVARGFRGTWLVYSVSSSAPDVAVATVTGSTVQLTALAAGTTTLTVTAENSEGSATQTFAVNVRDLPPAVGETLPAQTLTVGDMMGLDVADAFTGSALVFSAASSAPDLAAVSVSESTLALSALAAGEAMVTVTASNSEGSAMQTFALVVEDEHPVAVSPLADITLTVGEAMDMDVAAAFTGSALVFSAASSGEQRASVSMSGATATVAAHAQGTATVTVTAANTAGSAMQTFIVTVLDQVPATVGSLPDVSLTTGGDSATFDVAGYFTGSALVYTVAATGDAVAASASGAQVTVAPLVEGQSTVTVTATNTAGMAAQSFRATVTTDAAESSAMTMGFAAIGASTLSSVSSAIGARFGDVRDGVAAAPLASAWQAGRSGWRAEHAALPHDGWSEAGWQPFMPDLGVGRTTFNAATGQTVAWQQPARWTVWGHADRQSFEGLGYDGGLTSIYVGADADFGDRWMAGFALSRSAGDADYDFASARASGTGTIETEMLSIFPYVRWAVGDAAEAWAILGFGWGDADHARTATRQRGAADVSMWMASLGGRRTLAAADAWRLSLLGDASVLDLETDGGVGIVNGLQVGVRRLRAGLEAGRDVALDGGGVVTWFGQLAARHDGGDGETGGGAELTGGLRYDSGMRLSLEAKARMLGMHAADDYEENGFSVSVLVRPGADSEGVSFALSSHSGAGMQAGRSLVRGDAQPGIQAWRDHDDWAFDARLGYTLASHSMPGLLTPFAELDIADDSRFTMLGLHADLSERRGFERLDIEFAGGFGGHELRRAGLGGRPVSGAVFELRSELRF